VNADGLPDHSRILLEILDEQFAPMPGFSGNDAAVIAHSSFREQAAWAGKGSLAGLARPVRLKTSFGGIRAEDARVYAIYVET